MQTHASSVINTENKYKFKRKCYFFPLTEMQAQINYFCYIQNNFKKRSFCLSWEIVFFVCNNIFFIADKKFNIQKQFEVKINSVMLFKQSVT